MHLGLKTLEAFLRAHSTSPHLVLAVVTATEGSTYRKPGAMMLIGPGVISRGWFPAAVSRVTSVNARGR